MITDFIHSNIVETLDPSFGQTFDAYGRFIAVGVPNYNDNEGAVVVFEESSSGYILSSVNFPPDGILRPLEAIQNAQFGNRIQVTERSIIVQGNIQMDSNNTIFVFEPITSNAVRYQDQTIQGNMSIRDTLTANVISASQLTINGAEIFEGNVFQLVGTNETYPIYQQKKDTVLFLNGTDYSNMYPNDMVYYGNIGNVHFDAPIVSFNTGTELRIYPSDSREIYDIITSSPWRPVVSSVLTGGDIVFNSGINYIQGQSRIGVHTDTPQYIFDVNGDIGASEIQVNLGNISHINANIVSVEQSIETNELSALNGNIIISNQTISASQINVDFNQISGNVISANQLNITTLDVNTLNAIHSNIPNIDNAQLTTNQITGKLTTNNEIDISNNITIQSNQDVIIKKKNQPSVQVRLSNQQLLLNENITLHQVEKPEIIVSTDAMNVTFNPKIFTETDHISCSFIVEHRIPTDTWIIQNIKKYQYTTDFFTIDTGTDVFINYTTDMSQYQKIKIQPNQTYTLDVSGLDETYAFYMFDSSDNNVLINVNASSKTLNLSSIGLSSTFPAYYRNSVGENFIGNVTFMSTNGPFTFGYGSSVKNLFPSVIIQ